MARSKTTAPAPEFHADGWENLMSGLGDATRDIRYQTHNVTRLLGYDQARELYRGDDMAKRVINFPAREMVRKGWKIRVPDDVEASKFADEEHKRLKVRKRFFDALRWSRLYGGAGILIGANDGVGLNDLVKPLNEEGIRSIDYLTALDTRELQVVRYYSNPLDARFGTPEIYRLNPWALGSPTIGLVEVHESRVLRFSQDPGARVELLFNFGWGDSVLSPMFEVLRDFGIGWAAAAALLNDFSLAIYKIKGLQQSVATNRSGAVIARMRLIDQSKSVIRGVMLDADGEDFDRKSTSLTGLPDTLDRLASRLAAAAEMPVSALMGEAPAGLNATGDSDFRWFYDKIEADQVDHALEPLTRLTELLFKVKGKTVPEGLSIQFVPLWQLDDTQKADVRQKIAAADQIYLANGVVTADEVSRSRFGGDEFGIDLHLDDETREAFADVDPNDPDAQTEAAALRGGGNANAAPGAGKATPPSDGTPPGRPVQGSPASVPMPGAKGPGVGALPKASDSSLAGPQIGAAHDLVMSAAKKEIPRESAVAMLTHLFGLAPEQAEAIVAGAGKDFEPPKPDPVVMPSNDPNSAPGKKPAPKEPAK
jgi:phage-related protein (TIGR01555 family)